MKNYLFSVIIPTYNQCQYLKKAISSVINQKYNNFEIIIIDNYSDDDTEKIIREFKNNKIKYLKKKNNGVIGLSRNEGIKVSSGDWIAFLDSDDIWYENKLEEINKFLQLNPNVDVITNDEKIINKNTNKTSVWKYGPYSKDFYKKLLSEGNCLSTSATIVKKSFISSHGILFSEKKEFATVEDYDFFLNLALIDAKFVFFHKVLGEHLFHNQSQSSNFEKYKSAYNALIDFHVNEVQQFTLNKKKLKKKLGFHLKIMKAGRMLKIEKKFFQGVLYIFNIIITNPKSFIFFLLRKFK